MQYVNRQSFKQGIKPAVLLRPRNLHRHGSVFRACHPRHVRHQNRLELATVEMAPPPTLSVKQMGALATGRAGPSLIVAHHLHLDGSFRFFHRHAGHSPGSRQPKNMLVQLGVVHDPKRISSNQISRGIP